MPPGTFGTLINCIDGRVQLPLIAWMREVQALDYVDLITEPGADGLLARDPVRAAELVRPKVALSITRHASQVVAIAGHHDCLAAPGTEDAHRQLLRQAVDVLLGWDLGVKIMALWVDAAWQVEVVVTRAGNE